MLFLNLGGACKCAHREPLREKETLRPYPLPMFLIKILSSRQSSRCTASRTVSLGPFSRNSISTRPSPRMAASVCSTTSECCYRAQLSGEALYYQFSSQIGTRQPTDAVLWQSTRIRPVASSATLPRFLCNSSICSITSISLKKDSACH